MGCGFRAFFTGWEDGFGVFGVAVHSYDYPTDPYIAGGYFERERHLRSESLDDAVRISAKHRIVGACHADVGYIAGPFGENFFVSGYHMGMGAEHATDLAVKIMSHRDLLAACLGVDIDYYYVR